MGKIIIVAVTCLSLLSCAKHGVECFSSVEVTGYYTPVLSDYSATTTEQIRVSGSLELHNASFLTFARVKGGGVTLTGQLLEYWNGYWTRRETPLSEAEKVWFPRERDYLQMRTIITLEDNQVRTYPKAFVDEAGLEGIGKIAEGEFIGWPWDCSTDDGVVAHRSAKCDKAWHVYEAPLDATGVTLELGVVATDKQFFDSESPRQVTIQPAPIDHMSNIFTARDLGPSIVGSRVDVYTGLGLQGLKDTMVLTKDNYQVCFQKAKP